MAARRRAFFVVAALLVAVTAVGALTVSAPAGNRSPLVQLVASPGPSEVTFLKNVAYTATIFNNQNSTFTHVRFHNPIPTTSGGPAVFKYASCPGALTATEFVCNASRLDAGRTATVLIVWQTPASGISSDCPGSIPSCMTNAGYFTIKEGTGQPGSSGPDTFPTLRVATSLLVVPDQNEAGGYALDPCTNPSNPTLVTNQSLSAGNPLSTSVCASSLPVGDIFNPGLSVEVDERNRVPSDPGITQVSGICIPEPGDSCLSSFTPFVFSPLATFTFRILNSSLPLVCTDDDDDDDDCKLRKITQVFDDGVLVSSSLTADPRVVSITTGPLVTTVVVQSSENGSWNFG